MSTLERVMRYFGYVRAIERPQETVARVIPQPVRRGMSLEEFRSFSDNVGGVRAFLDSDIGVSFMSVLRNATPAGFIRGTNVSETQGLIELGTIQGHMDCITLVEAMSEFTPKEQKEIEPDYGAMERNPKLYEETKE